VALPVLCACGHETCILPTALLSTHTGGFGKPVVTHLTGNMEATVDHWRRNSIVFDAILVGYLGSVEAVEAVSRLLDTMLSSEGVAIVDPAMADNGRLYSGFDESYAQAMTALCRKADIVIPNLTEAAMMAGVPYKDDMDLNYVNSVLDRLDMPCVILTGIGTRLNNTGILLRSGWKRYHYTHKQFDQSFHGTGDLFAACFTGSLMQGKTIEESIEIAGEFTCKTIENTILSPVHWYGLKFETALPELIRRLYKT
jgi:pyridoxine kinase